MVMTISGSGTITGMVVGGLPDGTVQQSDLAANVAGNGPAFSAYYTGSTQTCNAATYTKIVLNTEDFDTASCFDSATNSRFQPTVAGYYQINMGATMNQQGSSNTNSLIALYKNGAAYKTAGQQNSTGQSGNSSWSGLVYLNGSTDYIEMYMYTSNAIVNLATGTLTFTGFLARAA